MGRFKDLALKKEDKKQRRAKGFSFLFYFLLASLLVYFPFIIIGMIINFKYGLGIGFAIGFAIGSSVLSFITADICRNILALKKHGVSWKHFVWSTKHKITIDWKFFFKLAEKEQISFHVLEKKLYKWLDENTSHWHEMYGKIYFQKEEDLIYFKLVWY